MNSGNSVEEELLRWQKWAEDLLRSLQDMKGSGDWRHISSMAWAPSPWKETME